MAEEKKEPWLNLLALTTVILAVCATLATFKGGSHSTRAVLSQSLASDQWAYYQAKSIKGNLYELEARRYEDAKADAQKHGAAFGFAVIFLQIGILLSSIAALLKQKPVYYLGLGVGVVGIVYFVNGFLLFIPA